LVLKTTEPTGSDVWTAWQRVNQERPRGRV